MKNFILFCFIIIFSGCTRNERPISNFFGDAPTGEKNVKFDKLDFIEVKLDSVYTSLTGKGALTPDGRIYFFDRYLSKLYFFDTCGRLLDIKLGLGRGPGELYARVYGINFMDDGRLGLYGTSFDWYIFDKDINKIDEFMYNRIDDEDIAKSTLTYTHLYAQMIFREFNNKVYYPVYSGKLGFNYLDNTEQVLKRQAHIIEMDLATHTDKRVLGKGFPDLYHTDPMKNGFFKEPLFDVDKEGRFYLTFQADSLIYTYNNDFKPLKCYGEQGRNMNVDYRPLERVEDYYKYGESERKKRGYYTWIEYENKTGTLFRSYQKGAQSDKDGLQIYKDHIMIADIDVPEKLFVAGYIKPYFYSYVIADTKKEILKFYKFKIPGIE